MNHELPRQLAWAPPGTTALTPAEACQPRGTPVALACAHEPRHLPVWSGVAARRLRRVRAPTLVIHGEQDFRVPVSQGMQLFTALKSQKVPSKLVLFPDEGHWVLKPQNTLLWYSQFLDWIGQWTKAQ